MLHSSKARARRGEVSCRCCAARVPARTARAREARAWKREVQA